MPEVMCTGCGGSGIGRTGDTSSECYDCNGNGTVLERCGACGRFTKLEQHGHTCLRQEGMA